jgi:hypothetical protein
VNEKLPGLIRDLNDAVRATIATPPVPLVRQPAPKDFQPGTKYDGGRLTEIVTGPVTEELAGEEDWQRVVAEMGVVLPEGFRLVLSEARFDPAAWHRDGQGDDAVTRPVWRYRFQVVPAALGAGPDEDLEKLQAAARKAARAKPRPAVFDKVSLVVVLGDIQAGKVDRRGGTGELLERLEHAKAAVLRRARRIKPHQIVLVDAGDALEGFESSPNSDRTNDLQLTQQQRLWRQILWDWTQQLSKLAPELDVISVPSNHCSVRRGKQNMANPADDFGIEVLSQVSDIARGNPAAYGHVRFWSPGEWEEACALTLVGGKTLGVVHGHQKTRPELAGQYMAGQALGRTPIGQADIVVMGHWHNFRVQTFGDDRWLMIAPTMDSGSSWFANSTGTESAPGVLSFVVDERGWQDIDVAWARAGVDYEVLT